MEVISFSGVSFLMDTNRILYVYGSNPLIAVGSYSKEKVLTLVPGWILYYGDRRTPRRQRSVL